MKIANTAILALFVTFANACVSEQRLQRSDLPVSIQNAADAQSAGATVVGYAKDIEKGKVKFEVQLIAGGHAKDITMDAQGNVLEIEEEVAMDALPTNILHGLSLQAKQGKLVKVESVSKKGQIVAYEAQVATRGKRSEIEVGADGQKLRHKH